MAGKELGLLQPNIEDRLKDRALHVGAIQVEKVTRSNTRCNQQLSPNREGTQRAKSLDQEHVRGE